MRLFSYAEHLFQDNFESLSLDQTQSPLRNGLFGGEEGGTATVFGKITEQVNCIISATEERERKERDGNESRKLRVQCKYSHYADFPRWLTVWRI